jgi:hypothetical protein
MKNESGSESKTASKPGSDYRESLSNDRLRYRWVSDHGERMFHRERKEVKNPKTNSTAKPVNTLAKKVTRWPF